LFGRPSRCRACGRVNQSIVRRRRACRPCCRPSPNGERLGDGVLS
jgi:hypothetical protein